MKKGIIKWLTATFAIGMFCINASAAENNVATVSYGEAVIDGERDECYTLFTPIETKIAIDSNPRAGAEAKIWLAWDYEGINVYAEIADATPDVASGTAYECDSIELFMDEDHSKADVTDANDGQWRIGRDNRHSIGISAQDNFQSVAVEKNDIYVVETKLPWLQKIPRDGMTIGFDVQVNDAQYGIRQTIMLWSSSATSNYRTTLNYGELKLVNGDYYRPWDKIRPMIITLDGNRIDCGDTDPVVVDGRTLVPMRALFDCFDAGVVWNGKEQSVYAIGNDKFIKLPIGSKYVTVDSEQKELDVPAMLINDRTMVPMRFVAETFGCTVSYDENVGVAAISSEDK